MSGLDPIGRKEIRDLIVRLHAEGKTVFMNTHILSDVEMLCDRVAIIVKGEIRYEGGTARRSSPTASSETRSRAAARLRRLWPRALEARFGPPARASAIASSCAFREKEVSEVLEAMPSPRGAQVVSVTPHRARSRSIFLSAVARGVAATDGRGARTPAHPVAIAGNTVREAIRSRVLYTLLFFALAPDRDGRAALDALLRRARAHPPGRGLRGDPALRRRDRDLRRHRPDPPRGRPAHDLHDPLEADLAQRVPARQVPGPAWRRCGCRSRSWARLRASSRWLAGAPLGAGHARGARCWSASSSRWWSAIATLFSSFTTPMLAVALHRPACGLIGHLSRDLRDARRAVATRRVSRRSTEAALPRAARPLERFDLTAHGAARAADRRRATSWLPAAPTRLGYVALLRARRRVRSCSSAATSAERVARALRSAHDEALADRASWRVRARVRRCWSGSFLNVVIHRLPRGESIVQPGSRCPGCGHAHPALRQRADALWLLLRGRCRGCGAPISRALPARRARDRRALRARRAAVRCGADALGAGASSARAARRRRGDRLRAPDHSRRDLARRARAGPRRWCRCAAVLEGAPWRDAFLQRGAGALLGGGLLWIVGFVHARVSRGVGPHASSTGRATATTFRAAARSTTGPGSPGMGFGDVKLLAMIGAFLGPVGVLETIVVASLVGLVLGLGFGCSCAVAGTCRSASALRWPSARSSRSCSCPVAPAPALVTSG